MMQADAVVELGGHFAQENQNQHQIVESQPKSHYLRLYEAAQNNNWRDAKVILEADRDVIGYSITKTHESIFHIALTSKHMAFAKKVVQFVTDEDLELTNVNGDTALFFAVKSGIVTIAMEMVKKNNRLPLIRSSVERMVPLHKAALLGLRDMVSYLFTVTSFKGLSPYERMEILNATITNNIYDIALEILKRERTLATEYYGNNIAALLDLARKPFALSSKSQLSFWKRCFNWLKGGHKSNKAFMQDLVLELVDLISNKVQLFEDRKYSPIVRTLLFDAAKCGNAEFVNILIRSYPNIIWITDINNRSLFHIAVIHRQERVFKLIHETIAAKEIILTYVDFYKQNNILHLAGKSASPSRLNIVSGAALQMQRELLWFKEVEKTVRPSYLNVKNYEGHTPWDLFTESHKNLRTEGEKWMKDTANYCMIVATLITTVVFAAAFTVPGGSNPDTGIPIFLKTKWFRVFFISDAIALVFSSSSILIFLSILTSRFTEMDFHVSLPQKLGLGLFGLFISIVSMVVAFSATSFLVFKSEMEWLPIVIIASACVPIILFVLLNYKLCADIIWSTYLSRFLFWQSKNRILQTFNVSGVPPFGT